MRSGGHPYVIPMALRFLFSFMDVRYARRLARVPRCERKIKIREYASVFAMSSCHFQRGWDMKSPLTLLHSHGRSFDDPPHTHTHTQDSMIKRDPFFLSFSFWVGDFSLRSRPFPRECGVESQAAASEIRLMASIRNSLLSFSRSLPSHLAPSRFVLTSLRFQSADHYFARGIFYAPDNTGEDLTRWHPTNEEVRIEKES